MSEQRTVELILQVEIDDADQEELDLQTRKLLQEIRAEDVESAELVSRPLEQGTKAMEAAEIGSIAVELGPVILPSLFSTISAWINRDKGRNVKFKGLVNGKMVEFEGNMEDFERIITILKHVDAKSARPART